jgi:hypothetical protein
MDSIKEIDENLGGICLLVQHKLIHKVETLEYYFSKQVRIVSWRRI